MSHFNMNNFFLPSHPSNMAWPLVKKLLVKMKAPITVQTIMETINKYQPSPLDFTNLKYIFKKEPSAFIQNLSNKVFPTMVRLLLDEQSKKEYIALKKLNIGKENKMVAQENYSAKDAAVFMSHSFFCTFPVRPNNYNIVNFSGLYESPLGVKTEILMCYLHYFTKIADNNYRPERILTINRVMVYPQNKEQWSNTDCPFQPLVFNSIGSIDDSKEFLQVDFANEQLGSNVLTGGSLQEQIRFVVYPETLVALLNCEKMTKHEAIIITGYEQFCNYKGFSENFSVSGSFDDKTKLDDCGNRLTQMVGMDAMFFSPYDNQFCEGNLLRELNKAYSGFYNYFNSPYGVSTGNWGCGLFGGNVELKALIQLMAASKAQRSVHYYSFGNNDVQGFPNFHQFLVNKKVTVGKLFSLLLDFSYTGSLYDALKSRL